MNRTVLRLACIAASLALVACEDIRPPRSAYKHDRVEVEREPPTAGATGGVPQDGQPAAKTAGFVPPDHDDIPEGPFGDMVRRGRDIFVDTGTHAPEFVGNGLSCGNCHIDAGLLPDSAPLWGAWGRYPAYRSKNQHVNNFQERLQGCFRYSMDGTPPEQGDEVLVALETYAFWMAQGVPVGAAMEGAGYAKDFEPPEPPDYARGEQVYAENCALCHGGNGEGQQVAGKYVFPPLWGGDSFNWGAGMHQLDNAAGFIKANMPLGRGNTLSDQQAWDVAMYMNAHERPQDPRYTGDLAETRAKFHDSPHSLYGLEVDGRLLGQGAQ
ncbi:c-type cytochrome [Novilysobacter spongiicola]|uniref:Cytochrome c n=1 Tax=Lysobacter spongiicola DSM 21749 TaxID=1122188 RepID=A0A1T4MJ24_9GAMM|nr:c-type cytochrome [Lysobacter spongiicola]SJZ66962.1 Cytochrome c [Lysobacter spongiicola DSM 21749]